MGTQRKYTLFHRKIDLLYILKSRFIVFSHKFSGSSEYLARNICCQDHSRIMVIVLCRTIGIASLRAK